MTDLARRDPEISARDQQAFREEGFLYLRDYVPHAILEAIRFTVSTWTRQLGLSLGYNIGDISAAQHSFDSGLLALRARDVTAGGQVYDALKKIPAFMSWCCSTKHVSLACQLLGIESAFVGIASRGYGIRIDYPGDTRHKTQLHQDVVSQLCSSRGIVIWAPLRDVFRDMGPVNLFPGSHKFGVFEVETLGHLSQDLVVRGENQLRNQFRSEVPEVRAGDAVVMDFNLLHESGYNATNLPRWSMITRLFDAGDPVALKLGWRGGLQEGNAWSNVAELFGEPSWRQASR